MPKNPRRSPVDIRPGLEVVDRTAQILAPVDDVLAIGIALVGHRGLELVAAFVGALVDGKQVGASAFQQMLGRSQLFARPDPESSVAGKGDDRLIRGLSLPRQVEIRAHALAAVGGVERDRLLDPVVRGLVVHRLDARVQRGLVVLERSKELAEDRVGHRRFAGVVAKRQLDPARQLLRHGAALNRLHAPEAVGCGTVEPVLGVGVVEGVDLVVPAAAEDEVLAAAIAFVERPLAGVPRHADRTEAADGLKGGNALRPVAVVAERDDRAAGHQVGDQIPVENRRQLLAGKLGERRGLVPADPRNRMVVLRLRGSRQPPRWKVQGARSGR